MLKIAELRREIGKTQQELATDLNMSIKKLAAWEQRRSEPSIEDICLLANYFNVSCDYLLGRENDEISINNEIEKRKELRPSTLKLVQACEPLNDIGIGIVIGYIARLIEEHGKDVLRVEKQ